MRIILFLLFLFMLAPNTAQAEGSLKNDPEITALYNSCVASLTVSGEDLENNYCYQMTSTFSIALFVTRNYLHFQHDDKSCAAKKFEVESDLAKIPPVVSSFSFSHEKTARSFIALIDSGVDIRNFPLLTSPADRAFAQSLAEWGKVSTQNTIAKDLKRSSTSSTKTDSGVLRPSSVDLIKSCKKYGQHNAGDSLCHANISGFLIIYGLAKSHPLPTYTEADPCYKEKNELLQQFIEGRQGCFPEEVDLKRHAAEYIASNWTPEMEKSSESHKNNAAYGAAGFLSSLYTCSK